MTTDQCLCMQNINNLLSVWSWYKILINSKWMKWNEISPITLWVKLYTQLPQNDGTLHNSLSELSQLLPWQTFYHSPTFYANTDIEWMEWDWRFKLDSLTVFLPIFRTLQFKKDVCPAIVVTFWMYRLSKYTELRKSLSWDKFGVVNMSSSLS